MTYKEIDSVRDALSLAARHRRDGRLSDGLNVAAVAEALAEDEGARRLRAVAKFEQGLNAYERGTLREARSMLEQAHLFSNVDSILRGSCARELGWCLVRMGDVSVGAELIEGALDAQASAQDSARCFLGLAMAAQQRERLPDASSLLSESEHLLGRANGDVAAAELLFVQALRHGIAEELEVAIDQAAESYRRYSRLRMGRATIALHLEISLQLRFGQYLEASKGIDRLHRSGEREGRPGYAWIGAVLRMICAAEFRQRSMWDLGAASIVSSYHLSGYASIWTTRILETAASSGHGLGWPSTDLWTLARDQWQRLGFPDRAELALKALDKSA